MTWNKWVGDMSKDMCPSGIHSDSYKLALAVFETIWIVVIIIIIIDENELNHIYILKNFAIIAIY